MKKTERITAVKKIDLKTLEFRGGQFVSKDKSDSTLYRCLRNFLIGYVGADLVVERFDFRKISMLTRILLWGVGYVLIRRWFGIYRGGRR